MNQQEKCSCNHPYHIGKCPAINCTCETKINNPRIINGLIVPL